MSKNSENTKTFKGQRHVYTGIFIFAIWGILLYLLYYYPHLEDCDDYEFFMFYMMITLFFVFIPLIVLMFISGKIVFQKNGIKLSGNGEYSGFYKYSEFQKVSYSSYGVSLLTASDREILQINLADFSIDDRNSILEEFRIRNKEVVVDDMWYGIIPEKIVKEEKRTPFMRQILEDKGFIAYALIVFYIFSFVGMGLSDSVCYDKHYDGVKKEYYENGTLHHETLYKNGKANGVAKTYHQNGRLSIESEYKDGKQNGIRKEYYENGNLRMEGEFKNGKQNGFVKEYDKNGTLRVETEFKDGKQDGIRKEYSEQGHLMAEAEFSNDKPHGITKTFSEQGKLEVEIEFSNGVVNGLFKQYFENGNLLCDGTVVDNKPEGIFNFYYENGKLKYMADLKSGVGMGTIYDEDGNPVGKKKMVCESVFKCGFED